MSARAVSVARARSEPTPPSDRCPAERGPVRRPSMLPRGGDFGGPALSEFASGRATRAGCP